jgi:Delta24-sterol reductase
MLIAGRSHGTLGFLVSVELDIIPAAKYVRLEYEPIRSKDVFLSRCKELFYSDHDFVEALVYGEDEYVLMIGNMTNQPPNGKLNAIGNYYKPWFYTHVQTFLSRGGDFEFIPLRDYYHRHTRSLFWEIKDIVPFGNNALFRYLFGWMMPPHIALMKRTQTEELRKLYELHHVVQDMLIPLSKLGESLR